MSFETFITWDNSNWTRAQRRTSASIVGPAIKVAKYGIDAMGISASIPYKTARICKKGPIDSSRGETDSATRFDLKFSAQDVRRNKIHRAAEQVPPIIFHELLHTIRFENYMDWTLAETAASEGIAYVLEDIFEKEHYILTDDDSLESAIQNTTRNRRYARKLKHMLYETDAAFTDYDDLDDKFIHAWDDISIVGFSPLEFMGIMAVRRGLELGNTPSDLLQAKASDILSFLD